MGKKKKKKKKKKTRPPVGPVSAYATDRHALYEASVQAPDINLLFVEQTFSARFGRPLRALREDFCGTARLACEWVSWDPAHRAWGVDLDRPTLDWGRQFHLNALGPDAERVDLREGDVRTEVTPAMDATVAFNFSYCIFQERDALKDWAGHVFGGLADQGMLVIDLFGGTEAGEVGVETRMVEDKLGPDGLPIPTFKYFWDQAGYNPLNHHLLSHIHFKLADGTRINKAFTYDWRLWSIPELRDVCREVGFSRVEIYTHGWEDDGTSNDVYRKVEHFQNESAWLAYLVAVKE